MPEAVISPVASSCLHRSLLSSVQWLPFRLGDSRCANRPSGSFLRVESIQPKHRASSTMSMYGSASGRGVFDLLQATQQHFSERWFCTNHSLSCLRSVNVNRFVISILFLLYRVCTILSTATVLAEHANPNIIKLLNGCIKHFWVIGQDASFEVPFSWRFHTHARAS